MSPRSQAMTGRYLFSSLALLALALIASNAQAQDPANATPKWEVFAGYSWNHPGLSLSNFPLRDQSIGYGVSLTRDLNRWVGLTADLGGHYTHGNAGPNKLDSAIHTFMVGPRFTYRGSDRFVPFAEGLLGVTRVTPNGFEPRHGVGVAAGGGIDINLTRSFALRLIQADYEAIATPHDDISEPISGQNGVRLQSGIVWKIGAQQEVAAAPPAASCSLQPNQVMAGEPVTATAAASNFPRKSTLSYSWSSTGGKVSGNGETATVDTTGLAGGSYNVTARVTDNKKSNAQCASSFTVNEPAKNAPTVSCSANPATVRSGEASTISCDCKSPDNRPVTLSNWMASSGRVSGSGNSSTLDTAGVSPGSITVGATCSDDRGLTAQGNAAVNVEAPPSVSEIERRLALHSVYFATARPTLQHPDAGLVPSQERILTTLASDFQTYLQSKPDARLTLEGHADPRGSVKYNQALSERRVNRVKRFLVQQGVPEADIQTTAFGKQRNLTDAEVRGAVEQNPELSPQDRQRMLKNMRTISLASNRRVDVTLNIAGQASQESVRQYPFNAADALTLLGTRGGTTNAAKRPAGKKAAAPARPKRAKKKAAPATP